MNTVVLCLLIVSISATAYGLKCYTCAGTDILGTGLSCLDQYNEPSADLQTCPTEAKYCQKSKAEISGKRAVTRMCSVACVEGKAEGAEIACCETDECNGSAAVYASTIVIISGIVAGLFFK